MSKGSGNDCSTHVSQSFRPWEKMLAEGLEIGLHSMTGRKDPKAHCTDSVMSHLE